MIRIIAALAVLFPFIANAQLVDQAAVGSFVYQFGLPPENANTGNGYVAILDLQSPDLVPQVTEPLACTTNDKPPIHGTAITRTTKSFAKKYGTFVAVTTNTGPFLSATESRCGVPSGLIVSGGRWVNWPETNGPVLSFMSAHDAWIINGLDRPLPPLPLIQNAVAGTIDIANDCATCKTAQGMTLQQRGTLLVRVGAPGLCPIPSHTERAARGAIGLDSTRRYLIIVIAEGGDSGTGLNTADFAQVVLAFGAESAVNFDGGGSTTFYWYPNDDLKYCEECGTKILAAKNYKPGPGAGPIQSVELLPHDHRVEYSSQWPERPVWASIGFRLVKQK